MLIIFLHKKLYYHSFNLIKIDLHNYISIKYIYYLMCGIWSLVNKSNKDVKKYLNDFWNLQNRGPDNSHLETFSNVYVGFHRLAIMDTSFNSNQPYVLHDKNRTIVFTCNGEIYNYKQLDKEYNFNIGTSDCLIIPKLYIYYTNNHSLSEFIDLFNNHIKGEFAFTLFEFDQMTKLSRYIVGRDHVGVRPLYCCTDNNDIDIYSSEIKGMLEYERDVKEFPPGTIKVVTNKTFEYVNEYYTFTDIYNQNIFHTDDNNQVNIEKSVRESVINSVKRRLVSHRPMAFLLSGGVDSSLVAAISAKLIGQPIRTFCCGMKGSTDMKYARMVADHIGSNHTEVYFTEEEGLEALEDVIYTIETWDTTTIRASVGQYLVSKYIGTKTDCRVVMVGEGPDEVCSSYLFNYYAPSPEALDKCSKEYVKNIHMYDGRRADRCISRWGLEARVAFLDPEFIKTYWNIPANLRHPHKQYSNNNKKYMEKFWLRQAFNGLNLLPDEILWRKKEAFSDGVSSEERSWYNILQEYSKNKTTNIIFNDGMIKPKTQEARLYRQLFIKKFGFKRVNIIPNYWQPKWDKDGKEVSDYVDPSARELDVY
jgi:asparagine synthase (glutamine-hydrolysing)